jgi:DNA-binding transcriptional ArsR family regulator
MDDRYELGNPKQVSAATSVMNMKILNLLATEQLNISEISARLGITIALANYHIKQLEDAELVTQLGEDVEVGRDRQRFIAVANRFRILTSRSDMSETERMRSIASARRSFEEALQRWELSMAGKWPISNSQPKTYGLANARVSPKRYRELYERASQLLNEFVAEEDYDGDDGIDCMLMCLFFPGTE